MTFFNTEGFNALVRVRIGQFLPDLRVRHESTAITSG